MMKSALYGSHGDGFVANWLYINTTALNISYFKLNLNTLQAINKLSLYSHLIIKHIIQIYCRLYGALKVWQQ